MVLQHAIFVRFSDEGFFDKGQTKEGMLILLVPQHQKWHFLQAKLFLYWRTVTHNWRTVASAIPDRR